MRKKIAKIIVTIGCVIFIICIALGGFNYYLDSKLQRVDLSSVEHKYGNQSDFILEESIQEGNVILMGSSELSSPVPQNPVNMFPNQDLKADVTIDGVAYVQSLLHSMNLAGVVKNSTTHSNGEKVKVVLVVSLQWFIYGDVDSNGFAANFSELQFWDYMYNKNISEKNKKSVCKRTKKLLATQKGFEDVKVFASLYLENNSASKTCSAILTPYYKAKYWMLGLQDKYQLYKSIITSKEDNKVAGNKYHIIDWDREAVAAEEMGSKEATNNEFFVEDEYYDTYLRGKLKDLKNYSSDEKLISGEREDFVTFLSTCEDLNIEPYIVMMNTNGSYYDYIGIDSETRNELYSWVRSETEKYGFDVLTMEDKEYEPYFMRDVMHLGWKGWLYVDEKITEHYAK